MWLIHPTPSRVARTRDACLLFLILCTVGLSGQGTGETTAPSWWPDDVSTTADPEAARRAAVRGQFDTMHEALVRALKRSFGESEAIRAIIFEPLAQTSTESNRALTIGEAKQSLTPVFDRLQENGIALSNAIAGSRLPWRTPGQDPLVDAAVVTIGQLKYVFSMDFDAQGPPVFEHVPDVPARVGEPYSERIGLGGTRPLQLSVTSGPDWLGVKQDQEGNWRLTGLPPVPGEFVVVLMVEDAAGICRSVRFLLNVDNGDPDVDPFTTYIGFKPAIKVYKGDYQTLRRDVLSRPVVLRIEDETGAAIPSAPLRVTVPSANADLVFGWPPDELTEIESGSVIRACPSGYLASPYLYIRAHADAEKRVEVEFAAGRETLRLSWRIDDEILLPAPRDFQVVANPDNTLTYTWRGDPGNAESFVITLPAQDGGQEPAYEIPVADLPEPDPDTGRYSITIPASTLKLP